jgi:hypothetical protein
MRGLITGQTEIKQSHLKQLKAVDNLIEKIKGDEAEQVLTRLCVLNQLKFFVIEKACKEFVS